MWSVLRDGVVVNKTRSQRGASISAETRRELDRRAGLSTSYTIMDEYGRMDEILPVTRRQVLDAISLLGGRLPQ